MTTNPGTPGGLVRAENQASRRVTALHVNQHVRVEQFHLLRPFSLLTFAPQRTCVGGSIDDIGPCADERGCLPVRNQLRAAAWLEQ